MIDIKTKIHDNFSLEFKDGFVVRHKVKKNLFAVNTWIFIPNSLDINPQTYGKSQFYRDIKSNVRMITPIYLLRDLSHTESLPYKLLAEAMNAVASSPSRSNISNYEYQIKMYCAIVKSSVRDAVHHIMAEKNGDRAYLCQDYLKNVKAIISLFRSLRPIVNVPTLSDDLREYYAFGDEFIGHISTLYTFRIVKMMDHEGVFPELRTQLADLLIENERHARQMGYPVVSENDEASNVALVFRHGILKKFVESDLYIKIRKKKDGVAVEQLLYSIAAGIAMLFATVVSFLTQKTFGSLSGPLFFVLIISYMLKDRIKELMRYWFAHRLGSKFFDNKAHIKVKEEEVGWMKEGVDFITDEKCPKEVLSLRNRSSLLEADNKIFDEKILLYRKMVYINSKKLAENNTYDISGINDILRFHLTRFTQKMDNPEQPLQIIREDGTIGEIMSPKIYYINFIIQVRYEDQIDYKRFRIALTRNGIQEVREI